MKERVLNTIRDHQLIKLGDRVLLGVSGGADSMALLSVMIKLREQLSCEIGVAHLHHDMRGVMADEDARYVENYCHEYQIPFYFQKTNVLALAEREKIGVEEAGRKARYDFFTQVMEEEGYSKIAVAHHRDDQAETLLFRLIRGTGITGAAGIRYREGNVIRPLLDVSRQEIESWCKQNIILYRHDSTNDDDMLTRNRLRHQIMPLLFEINPETAKHFSDFCNQAEETAFYIQMQTEKAVDELFHWDETGLCFSVREFLELPALIRKEVLRKALGMAGGTMVDVERRHISIIEKQMIDGDSVWSLDLPHQVVVRRQYDTLFFQSLPIEMKKINSVFIRTDDPGMVVVGDYKIRTEVLSWPNLKTDEKCKKFTTFYISYGKIINNLVFRHRLPGDRIMLPDGRGHQSVKKLFIQKKIPAHLRDSIPLLVRGDEILWIPGVAACPHKSINDGETKILKLTMENIHESRH